VICQTCAATRDGLLGVDLVGRFGIDVDLQAGRVFMPGCE